MEALSYCQLMERCLAAESKVNHLAEENAALKKLQLTAGMISAGQAMRAAQETPATDAAIAALHAEGVEMLLTENFKAKIAGALADFDGVDDTTLQTLIWSGQPPEPDGDVWHIEYMARGYEVQKKIREFAAQLRSQQSQVIKSQPVEQDGGWIEWNGGHCPVAGSKLVYVRFRNGTESSLTSAKEWVWIHVNSPFDIIAYRLHKSWNEE